MENSKIEWCDHTFNPWMGCTKVSPGCDNCYAEALTKRYGKVKWGPHGERKRTSENYWKQPLRWAKKAGEAQAYWLRWSDAKYPPPRPRVFCASLADWLDNQVPQELREDLARLINVTPELDWLLLTKRIENFSKLSPWPLPTPGGDHGQIPFPRNVWLGITTEDQEHYNKRWPILARIPAAVRFISYEPALGPLDLDQNGAFLTPDWVIAGGESGPHARTPDSAWFSDLRGQCDVSGIPFFFKQWGGRTPKAGGRVLDGQVYSQLPQSRWAA
jgi:protein gp37